MLKITKGRAARREPGRVGGREKLKQSEGQNDITHCQFGNNNNRKITCVFGGVESGEGEARGNQDRRVCKTLLCLKTVIMNNTKTKMALCLGWRLVAMFGNQY